MATKTKKKDVPAAESKPIASEDTWRAESDFRTLKEAELIKQDAERFDKAVKFGKKEIKAMRSVEDIVKYKNEKYGSGGKDE